MKWTLLALVVVLLTASTCSTPVEFCYVHPKYGTVCVNINGTKRAVDRPDLTPEQKKEVEDWLKTQP